MEEAAADLLSIYYNKSSKQAEKRAKKDHIAITRALRDEIGDHEDNNYRNSGSDSDSDSDSDDVTPPSSPIERKASGHAKIDWVAPVDGKRIEVEFNEYGQAVGKNSNKLSSYIGHLVREKVPITYGNWHQVDKDLKERLWIAVKQCFIIEECHRKWVLMSMGKTWRTYKSELSRKIRKLVSSKNVKDHLTALNDLKPNHIKSDEEWEQFVKQRSSKEFKKKSSHFQTLRGKQQKVHRTSRKGMARLRHEMKEEKPKEPVSRVDVWIRAYSKKDGSLSNQEVAKTLEKLEEYRRTQSSDGSTNADALNHIYGAERPGRVLAGGFGATPTKMALDTLGKSKKTNMEHQLRDLNNKYDELKDLLMKHLVGRQVEGVDTMQDSTNTPQNIPRTTEGGCISNNVENGLCKLLDWMGTGNIVGEGKIASMDPYSQVHNMFLGPDCWKIWVTVALMDNTPLYRPTSEFHLLSDARESTVAWPKKYIVLD